jgi:diguanylate cyclase (GGDEF)-like protein
MENQILGITLAVITLVLFVALMFILSTQAAHNKKLRNQVEKLLSTSHAQAARIEELVEIAFTDPLTGLSNRRQFEMEATLMLQLLSKPPSGGEDHLRREGLETLTLLLMDVDNFKKINDVYGHAAGDTVLAKIARWIRSAVRESDLVCRWGGEEIVLLLPDTAEEALVVAEKIRAGVPELRFGIDGLEKVTISLGLCSTSHQGPLKALTDCADGAMYEAKRAGRNRVCVASFPT